MPEDVTVSEEASRYDVCTATHRDSERDHEACRVDAVVGPDVPHEPHAVVLQLILALHAAGAAVTAGVWTSQHACALHG
jgi:hypothetical protein